ncbi:MAG TPA: Ku protein [Gammaproteobacteria bacterium]|nr:Ku protein [Gammaproteobacteria bacterium]
MAEDDEQNGEEALRPRPFWSGTIAFGLVSLPVSLFPANRKRGVSLRMVDRQGMPLARRYCCEKDNELLEREDIVRGYEVDKQSWVVIKDEELEALAPEKSREIDLRRFVNLAEIDPIYFERGYFLVPEEGSTKAYRLLARAMEEERRAGIATFVMRGKEYLVAIIAERGILRAETLRFHDEIRTPEYVGLPELAEAAADSVRQMQKAMQAWFAKRFDRKELVDPQTERLEALVTRKFKAGKDVLHAPEEIAEELAAESNVIDLMQVLKERMQGKGAPAAPEGEPPASRRRRGGGQAHRTPEEPARELEKLSRAELYARAQERDIPGRSRMSKEELIEALRH